MTSSGFELKAANWSSPPPDVTTIVDASRFSMRPPVFFVVRAAIAPATSGRMSAAAALSCALVSIKRKVMLPSARNCAAEAPAPTESGCSFSIRFSCAKDRGDGRPSGTVCEQLREMSLALAIKNMHSPR